MRLFCTLLLTVLGVVTSLDVVENDYGLRASNNDAAANESVMQDEEKVVANHMTYGEGGRRGKGRYRRRGKGRYRRGKGAIYTTLPLTKHRSYNGTELLGGWADSKLMRMSSPDYPEDESTGERTGEMIGEGPNPRIISNIVVAQSGSKPSARSLSDFAWVWGQFIDHDMDLTEPDDESGFAPIVIHDPSDLLYNGPPIGIIPFTRSEYDHTTGLSTDNPRQQMNLITSCIDGSGVYGSDEEKAHSLRYFENGKMKVTPVESTGETSMDLLPLDASGMFDAGDIRANEQVLLISMHTLFVREHNRLCDKILYNYPDSTDEEIYQMARKLVGATLQAITYNEWLPALLGPMARSLSHKKYKGFDKDMDPSIANEFSTAAFRMGHSMLSSELMMYDNYDYVGNVTLRNAFFRPQFILDDPINVDLLLMGAMKQKSQEIDNMIIDDVRNFLFGPPGAGGFDLASLNMQRGRDHGLPKYNAVRESFGLAPKASFAEVTSDPDLAGKLAAVYSSPDEIDAWLGGLCEDHVWGASVGELIGTALEHQFKRLRDGDPYFYLTDKDVQNWQVRKTIMDVNKVKFSDIIRANTQNNVHGNVFFA